MSSSPFDFLNAINETKENLMAAGVRGYSAFMVNRGLSYFSDTILHASEMNRLSHLDADMQFAYLMGAVRKKRRRSRWAKAVKSEDLDAISTAYKYSMRRAREVLPLLSSDQLAELRSMTQRSG